MFDMVYVSKVIAFDDFRIVIFYKNNETRLFDMTKSWLWEKKSYQILHNPEEFKKVEPFLDTIQWNLGDYTLEVAPEELYEESISLNGLLLNDELCSTKIG